MQDELFLRKCRKLAGSEPARALVLLRLYLRRQEAFEEGFSRHRCVAEAARAEAALAAGDAPPAVHPVALLCAVDRYLAASCDVGHEPLIRRIEAPEGAFLVVPRAPGWESRLARNQPGHLEFWMRRHQVVPAEIRGITVEVRRPSRDLSQRLEASRLRFATGGFLDSVLPAWNDRSPYSCRELQDPEARWTSVCELLQQASRRGTTLVVLPELTIDPQVRARLRDWLIEHGPAHGLDLVVAGSFHEEKRNVARILDGHGDEVVHHRKLRPMRSADDGSNVDEDIQGGHCIRLLHAPFGLVGTAICLDFCEIGDVPVAELWGAVGPALMLVPSMGSETTNHAHRNRARPLALQHGTTTLVASQHPKEPLACGLAWSRAARPRRAKPVLYGALQWTTD